MSRVTAPIALRNTANDLSTAATRLVDVSRAMRNVRALATRAAAGDAKVFITGESGVGKDVVAQYIHAHSSRASRPYIAVNCAAIADSLLETELFGHARGSFTGAYRDRMGRLEAAHRGTIFLDEIAEMTLQMQAHLLRFLESGEIQPVGSSGSPIKLDVRIISATNRDLEQLVATGAFRSDLLYRIKVLHIHVPPLRERKEDLSLLIDAAATRTGRQIRFTEAALQALSRYRWPGNVRELQNVIEQAAWMSESGEVDTGRPPGNCPARIDGHSDSSSRTSAASGRRPLQYARRRPLHVLGTHSSAAAQARHHPARSATARQPRPDLDARQLPRTAEVVRHGRGRLQALHEFPRRARMHGGLSPVPGAAPHGAPDAALDAARPAHYAPVQGILSPAPDQRRILVWLPRFSLLSSSARTARGY